MRSSCDSHRATSEAMAEVTSAVIATSLVLISVFIPVSFFPGTTGILYKQFSLTIAFSIAISAFNALTLSPALAAILLRQEHEAWRPAWTCLRRVLQKVISWLRITSSPMSSECARSCCCSSLRACGTATCTACADGFRSV